MTTDHSDPAGLERMHAIYGLTATGCRAMRGPEKPKGCWNRLEAERPTISDTMTVQAAETEARYLGMDPFTALGAFLAASTLAQGTSRSRGLGLPAPG